MGPEDWVGSKKQGWGVEGQPKSSAETMAGREKDIFRASGWEGWLVGLVGCFSQSGFSGH